MWMWMGESGIMDDFQLFDRLMGCPFIMMWNTGEVLPLPCLKDPLLWHTLGGLWIVHSHTTELSELSLWWPLPFMGSCSCSLFCLVTCCLWCYSLPVLVTGVLLLSHGWMGLSYTCLFGINPSFSTLNSHTAVWSSQILLKSWKQ